VNNSQRCNSSRNSNRLLHKALVTSQIQLRLQLEEVSGLADLGAEILEGRARE
jgi:hypothetical protein